MTGPGPKPGPKLRAALEIFTELGWHKATGADAPGLSLGSPQQRRTAKAGLSGGAWDAWTEVGPDSFSFVSLLGPVDPAALALFAIRVGVDARRAANLYQLSKVVGPDDLLRVLVTRGQEFAEAYIDASSQRSRRMGEHTPTWSAALCLALGEAFDLPVPAHVEHLKDWAAYAAVLLDPLDDLAGAYLDGVTQAQVLRRFPERAEAALRVGVPGIGPLPRALANGLAHGLLERDWLVVLVIDALTAVQRPGDQRAWAHFLVDELQLNGPELRSQATAFVPALASGNAQVISRLAPLLIHDDLPDDQLAEMVIAAFTVRTAKGKRELLELLAARRRPSGAAYDMVLEEVRAAGAADSALTRAADIVLAAWGAEPMSSTTIPPTVEVLGLWQPTPPRWEVPRLDLGCAADLPAVIAEVAGQPYGAWDITSERLIGLIHRIEQSEPGSARAILRSIRSERQGLQEAGRWARGEALDEHFRRTDLGQSRTSQLFVRIDQLPAILSMPTWVDGRIDPTDLVDGLRAYARTGAPVCEADLLLAVMRVDPAQVTDRHRAQLDALPVVVEAEWDRPLRVAPLGEVLDAACELPRTTTELGPAEIGRWLNTFRWPRAWAAFPRRRWDVWSRDEALLALPALGDASATAVQASFLVEGTPLGVSAKQLARRATLGPGAAMNLLGALRAQSSAAGAALVAEAVEDAWQRGLLTPGLARLDHLDWTGELPTRVAALVQGLLQAADGGLLSVVWPVLHDLVAATATGPRIRAGAQDALRAIETYLPEVRDAVHRCVAPPQSLDLPAVRAVAARSGSGKAVVTARRVVAALPPSTDESA